jgi:hypothetical protein
MHSVRILHISPVEAIELKNQLLLAGLVIEQDFEWAWITAEYNDVEGWTRQKHAEFRFHDAAMATFYQLKWAR